MQLIEYEDERSVCFLQDIIDTDYDLICWDT